MFEAIPNMPAAYMENVECFCRISYQKKGRDSVDKKEDIYGWPDRRAKNFKNPS